MRSSYPTPTVYTIYSCQPHLDKLSTRIYPSTTAQLYLNLTLSSHFTYPTIAAPTSTLATTTISSFIDVSPPLLTAFHGHHHHTCSYMLNISTYHITLIILLTEIDQTHLSMQPECSRHYLSLVWLRCFTYQTLIIPLIRHNIHLHSHVNRSTQL